jgi:hypothetical protein
MDKKLKQKPSQDVLGAETNARASSEELAKQSGMASQYRGDAFDPRSLVCGRKERGRAYVPSI